LTAAEAMAYVVRAFVPGAKLPESVDELKPIYLSVLSGQHALLLMDNALDARQVAPLLPPKGSVLLVTSRFHFTVPGLRARNLDTLPPADARDLFLTIAGVAPAFRACPERGEGPARPDLEDAGLKPGATRAQDIAARADEIVRLCGCLPLALRLAGTALAERIDLSPASYQQRLEKERLRVLKETATDPGVEASIGLSYGLLDPETQKYWRMLAVFPDTFDAPLRQFGKWTVAPRRMSSAGWYSTHCWNGTMRPGATTCTTWCATLPAAVWSRRRPRPPRCGTPTISRLFSGRPMICTYRGANR